MNQDQVLRSFMTKMDRLWKLFDQAVDKIPRGDAMAFRRYSENLDKFFVCYWHTFNEALGESAVDDLVRSADLQFEESQRFLEMTWHNTTDALLRRATDLKDNSRARSLPLLLATFQKAERLLKESRKGDTIQKRISNQVEGADLLEEFIGKLESAK